MFSAFKVSCWVSWTHLDYPGCLKAWNLNYIYKVPFAGSITNLQVLRLACAHLRRVRVLFSLPHHWFVVTSQKWSYIPRCSEGISIQNGTAGYKMENLTHVYWEKQNYPLTNETPPRTSPYPLANELAAWILAKLPPLQSLSLKTALPNPQWLSCSLPQFVSWIVIPL